MVKTLITAVMATTLTASLALAAPFTIQTDDDVLFLRCTDMYGVANCEAIFPTLDEVYRCIAFDVAGKSLAVASAIGGMLVYPDLDASLIADVKCRM